MFKINNLNRKQKQKEDVKRLIIIIICRLVGLCPNHLMVMIPFCVVFAVSSINLLSKLIYKGANKVVGLIFL